MGTTKIKKTETMSHVDLTKLAFVDIETTGTSATSEGIIEIAVILVDNNEVTEEWSTLINPQKYISPFIENYTGISNADVEDAPLFEEIAEELQEKLSGRIFIAHNVRFDYGFIKNSFKRCNIDWRSKQMCTVKLSRSLYPMFRKHNLDAIIERHNIYCHNRHRAMGDTAVLWEFWQKVHFEFTEDILLGAIKSIMKIPSMPLNIDYEEIDALPETPGVYFFYGEGERPIYIGKSVDIRKRVLSHFSSDHRVAKDMKIAAQLKRIEFEETAGELDALLKESAYIKEYLPIYNRLLRRSKNLYTCMLKKNADGYKQIEILCPDEIHVDDLENIAGVFRSQKKAEQTLREISKAYDLCDKILGLENATHSCFKYQLKRCSGACVGEESPGIYNMKQDMAFQSLKIRSWPYEGVIGIREFHKSAKNPVVHVLYKWCYLGSGSSDEDVQNILSSIPQDLYFDYDTYKIFTSFMFSRTKKKKHIQVIHLAPHPKYSEYTEDFYS